MQPSSGYDECGKIALNDRNMEDTEMPAVTSSPAVPNHHATVIFVFLGLSALAWIGVSTVLDRQTAGTVIRESPEYRCIAAASGKEPRVQWSGLRNLGGPNTGFTVGTVIERPGMKCIEDGDAISFVMLPESRGAPLSAIRIKGREVRAEFREKGRWADVMDVTGAERWRNNGDGYRKISP
jgi:hypothetical protein